MVALKQAVKTAEQTLRELLDNASGVQLEELLISSDEKYWLVTLSYLAPFAENEIAPRTIYTDLVGKPNDTSKSPRLIRKYKTFEIDRTTGDFHQMKIRAIESV